MGGPKEQDASPAAEAATAAKENGNGHGHAAPPESNRWTEVNGRPRPSGRENWPANLPVANGSISGSGGSGGSVGAPPPAAMKQQRRRNDRHPNGNMAEQPVCRDMDALRSQMETARAGTGEVARIIRSSTFQPREAAFTKLIQACVPSHDWQKALELWDVMRATPELKPNTISYRWEEAEKIFAEQLVAAKTDEECKPNRITYSSLLTACTKGNRVDRALHWYEHMTQAHIEADFITYSVLIPGCLESAFPVERALGLMEDMHAAGHHASPETYCRIIERLGSKKQWQTALEVFLVAQMAGVEATPDTCIALLGAFEAAHQSLPAAQLLDSYTQTVAPPGVRLCTAALRVYAKAGSWQRAWFLWETRIRPAKLLDSVSARLLLDTLEKGGQQAQAAALAAEVKALGITPARSMQL